MTRIFERIIHSEVSVCVSHVVSNYVHHYPNISLVAGTHEINEVLFTSEFIIEAVKISAPISMVSAVSVVDDWRNPDGIKAHSLDVI